MGNFHCIPSSCAKVVYREYLAPAIRWRYPGEDWNEIEADDYQLEQSKYQCPIFYNLRVQRLADNGQPIGNSYLTSPTVQGALGQMRLTDFGNFVRDLYPNDFPFRYLRARGRSFFRLEVKQGSSFVSLGLNNESSRGIDLIGFETVGGQPDNCGDCTFTITSNGNTVYTETRSDCPEVEKLDCRLSDTPKIIAIDKLPYLQRIEVRNQLVNVIYVPPLNAPFLDINSLQHECLNIYNTITTAPPFLSDFVPLPGVINPYQFIAQICSADGCPPPEYQVICDCNCEECPDDTCAVNCDGHICCYDTTTGISIKQIAIADYCGGDTL